MSLLIARIIKPYATQFSPHNPPPRRRCLRIGRYKDALCILQADKLRRMHSVDQ